MKDATDAMFAFGQRNGVRYKFQCPAVALVRDDSGHIVGLVAREDFDNEVYIHAKAAVVLTAGGFCNNKALLEKYIPTAAMGCASSYLVGGETGECFRMGLGVGADVSGFNSSASFDGGVDWEAEGGQWARFLYDAIDADVLKRRDALEELEADLGFAPGVLTKAVAKWNECCERGEDDFMYPMPPEWLHSITTPPFYGCRIGGNLYGTKAGLLINDQMQVIGTNGLVIPGLYAGWHTAGGACGENSYIGDPILGSLMGDVGLAFCGGYLCGTSAVEHELQGVE